MNPQQSISYLCHTDWLTCKPGLSRINELLSLLGNPENDLKFVHITGTNGKGSTSAMTASILRDAGYCVGLYTSPCLQNFNERIRINGVTITDKEIAELTSYIRPFAESMKEHPTEFEMVTALGLLYFKRSECDIVVLEVGMGGEFDATNAIPSPEVAIITAISLDHTSFLGNTVEEIAKTKSGIIKHGCDAVAYFQEDGILNEIRKRCSSEGVGLNVVDFSKITSLSHSLNGQSFDFGNYKNLFIKLLGNYQIKNASVAITAIECLMSRGFRITETNIRRGLARTLWSGRFEVLRKSPLFIVDGGHNPQCADVLMQSISDYLPNRKIVFLVGVLADKDYESMISKALPFASHFVTVTPNSHRALPSDQLAQYIARYNQSVTNCNSIKEGVKTAQDLAGNDGAVCAFGSLYMTGSILDCF